MKWRLILWAICIVRSFAVDWDASNFPNPTAGQFKECRMRTVAKICDPDGVLDDAGRNRLDYELQMLEQRTRQDQAPKFCDKKGVTAAMAIARRIKGGSVDAAKAMANDMLRRWTLDTQCQKAVVFVVSVEDQTFWTARDDKVPVYAQEFTQIFSQQRTQFKNQQYVEALKNILQGTWEKALSKQGSPRQPTGNVGGGGQRPSQGFGEGIGKGSGGSKGPELKMPSIPSWFWLTLIFLVIPLLCCCLCLYCCCCRGKGSSGGGGSGGGGRQPVPQDYPAGMGGGGVPASGGGGGGGRGMFGNFMSTAGGAGIGSMIGNFLSNRNRGGGGGVPMGGMGGGGYGGGGGDYQGGGAYPAEPEPVYDDNNGQGGGGLYPSVPVKDEGGGGSWA